MTALRMRIESRRGKRAVQKAHRKEVKQETKSLIKTCKAYARNGLYTVQSTFHYKTSDMRNAVAYNLRQKGYKVEITNRPDFYDITSISWVKVKKGGGR